MTTPGPRQGNTPAWSSQTAERSWDVSNPAIRETWLQLKVRLRGGGVNRKFIGDEPARRAELFRAVHMEPNGCAGAWSANPRPSVRRPTSSCGVIQAPPLQQTSAGAAPGARYGAVRFVHRLKAARNRHVVSNAASSTGCLRAAPTAKSSSDPLKI